MKAGLAALVLPGVSLRHLRPVFPLPSPRLREPGGERLAQGAKGPGHVGFNRLGGDAHHFGDLGVTQLVKTAQLEHFAATLRQRRECRTDRRVLFLFDHRMISRGSNFRGLEPRRSNLDHALVPQLIQGPVPHGAEQVPRNRHRLVQSRPTPPELEQDILGQVLAPGRIPEQAIADRDHPGVVFPEDPLEDCGVSGPQGREKLAIGHGIPERGDWRRQRWKRTHCDTRPVRHGSPPTQGSGSLRCLSGMADSHPDHDEQLDRLLDESAARLRTAGPAPDVERAWRRVAARMQETDAIAPPVSHVRWRPALALAATLLLAVIGGLWAWRHSQQAPLLAYDAPAGVPQVIPFQGGRMVLAPRSRLVARHRAGTRPEAVQLEGEAWFELAHDPRHPFTVTAGSATITDLGTTFSVRNRADGTVDVEVTEGSVSLSLPGAETRRLIAGQAARAAAGHITESRATAVTPDWVDGRLDFADAPMPDVQRELMRWYGLELRLGDPTLASRHVTASFQGDSVGRVLQVLALALGANVEQRGDTAILRLPGTPAAE